MRAPFAGVITVRNIDTGALVNEGNTLLFRIAQTDRLRTYLNVPQADAESVRVGQRAKLTVPDLSGRTFTGTVARTANALDPATRTLLVEVQVDNAGGALMPGMYAQVDLSVPRKNPPLMIPADALVVRARRPAGGGGERGRQSALHARAIGPRPRRPSRSALRRAGRRPPGGQSRRRGAGRREGEGGLRPPGRSKPARTSKFSIRTSG